MFRNPLREVDSSECGPDYGVNIVPNEFLCDSTAEKRCFFDVGIERVLVDIDVAVFSAREREISVANVLMFLWDSVLMIAIGMQPLPVPTSINVV